MANTYFPLTRTWVLDTAGVVTTDAMQIVGITYDPVAQAAGAVTFQEPGTTTTIMAIRTPTTTTIHDNTSRRWVGLKVGAITASTVCYVQLE